MSDTAPVSNMHAQDGGQEVLLSAAQAGDLAAYGQLVLLYEQPVFRLCYLLLRDEEAATELARVVLVSAQRSLQTLEPGITLLPWLLRRVIEHPLGQRNKGLIDTALPGGSLVPQLAPEVAIIGGERNRVMANALGGLADSDKLTIYLRYFLQLSHADMGKVLGLSEPEAAQRITGAVDRLSVQLGDLLQVAPEQS